MPENFNIKESNFKSPIILDEDLKASQEMQNFYEFPEIIISDASNKKNLNVNFFSDEEI